MFPIVSKIHQYVFLKRKEACEHNHHFKHMKEMNKVLFASLKHALELSSATSSNH